MKIGDLLKEKAALWVRKEKNSLDCLYVTDIEEDYHDYGSCECCGPTVEWYVDVTFETPKFPDQTFYGHIHSVRFEGKLSAFIEHLDRNYE